MTLARFQIMINASVITAPCSMLNLRCFRFTTLEARRGGVRYFYAFAVFSTLQQHLAFALVTMESAHERASLMYECCFNYLLSINLNGINVPQYKHTGLFLVVHKRGYKSFIDLKNINKGHVISHELTEAAWIHLLMSKWHEMKTDKVARDTGQSVSDVLERKDTLLAAKSPRYANCDRR